MSDNKLKYSVGMMEIVSIAVSVILIVVFAEYLNKNNISETTGFVVHVKGAVVTFVSALCGPVAGVLVGALSSICFDMIAARELRYGMFVAYALYGYFVGKFASKYGIREGNFNIINIANFNCIQMCANIMVFVLFVPLVRVIAHKTSIAATIKEALKITICNIMIGFVIITGVFLVISSVVKNIKSMESNK